MGTGSRSDFESGTISTGHRNVDNYNEPPTKLRRTNKACIQCRVRKQRCDGQSPKSPNAACSRCVHLGVECSFTTSPVDASHDGATVIVKTSHALERLQKRVAEQDGRLQRLERIISLLDAESGVEKERRSGLYPGNSESEVLRRDSGYNLSDRAAESNPDANAKTPDAPEVHDVVAHTGYDVYSPVATTTTHNQPLPSRHHAALDAVHLDTPMSTLRHLQQYNYSADQTKAMDDPVSSGLITLTEAQEAFDLYFSSCHKWAPVLCPRTQKSAASVRLACPTLFTSICAVAFRFMGPFPSAGPQHREIVKILDVSLSRLLLKPGTSDVHLGHIQALLLYVQWMPVDVQNSGGRLRTRYNDVSAWSMLGLAIRYALFLGLQDSPSAFLPEKQSSATIEDLARLRVWINLLTNDANLMLSSGLPASLNPEPVAQVCQTFASHRDAFQPEDMRVAALCELVVILKHAARSSGSPNVRALDAFSLRRANLEFDAWEVHWNQALGPELMHDQMPFTALRAYRLTVNSSCLSTLLARPAPESSSLNPRNVPLHSLEALDVSLTAACQTILALSGQSTWATWSTHSSIPFIPSAPLTVNRIAVERISFSVDSSWVSHSFAAVFLVLCFARGAIDDDLNILALAGSSSSLTAASRYPCRPRQESLLSRLITLAAEIFDIICSRYPLAHPATGYQTLLDAVFSPLLDTAVSGGNGAGDGKDFRDAELQAQGIETYLDEFFESMGRFDVGDSINEMYPIIYPDDYFDHRLQQVQQ
ncbi:C6 finger domain protein, putative [Talaromyces stipitatus ATCC 10500]|uniref:C6 finger domain protein, putative n=1 Tax=Talaromyces stipitatus (strain ATCC 10500 / CBS 375.48 / QM 6759 / NRRL 1006) TaxID=441959 RepID=B8MMK6_TALSN|nr:C6 finger domain protein, putative [Talaromyces stipitatus ATCC 10500]EED13760.1 C6 finger domain protein, putative [Talaromyces stipitatus ATCC 10500]